MNRRIRSPNAKLSSHLPDRGALSSRISSARSLRSVAVHRLTPLSSPFLHGPGVQYIRRALDKIGERVAKLQQLISPFGKSDTASVLSEATTYIRFLHKQIQVLSASYLQTSTVARQMEEGDYCNFRSRGLCLMPVASTLGLLKVMELSHTSRRVQLTCS